MKSTALMVPETEVLALPRARVADYIALTKPRIAVLVLFTVGIGVALAAGPNLDVWVFLHTVFGTALVAGGASALNQLIERHTDALMRRTESRPLPAGRLHPVEVLVVGIVLGVVGVAYLAVTLRQPWTPALALVTYILYVAVYTPLKPLTTLNTLVGAIPGALPPVIGWTAAREGVGPGAAILFAIVFLWQVPHFLAIAWMYRHDYAAAGLRMLPVVDPDGVKTGRNMVRFTLALLAASAAPVLLGAGAIYLAGALVLGVWFLTSGVRFAAAPSDGAARRVLRVSLVYLPGLLALLVLDSALDVP